MEKLFAQKNIRLQPIVDQDGNDSFIAYTDKLLEYNILIEFYGVATDNYSDVPEEVGIFAVSHFKETYYSFVLFVTDGVLGPLPVFRIISDAIDFIEQCSPDTVLADLEEVSTSTSLYGNKSYEGKDYYESEVWKFKTAMELIGSNA